MRGINENKIARKPWKNNGFVQYVVITFYEWQILMKKHWIHVSDKHIISIMILKFNKKIKTLTFK